MKGRIGRSSGGSMKSHAKGCVKDADKDEMACGGRAKKKDGGCVKDDDKDEMSKGGRLDRKPRKSGGKVIGGPDGAKNTVASVGSPIAKK